MAVKPVNCLPEWTYKNIYIFVHLAKPVLDMLLVTSG